MFKIVFKIFLSTNLSISMVLRMVSWVPQTPVFLNLSSTYKPFYSLPSALTLKRWYSGQAPISVPPTSGPTDIFFFTQTLVYSTFKKPFLRGRHWLYICPYWSNLNSLRTRDVTFWFIAPEESRLLESIFDFKQRINQLNVHPWEYSQI